MQRVQVIPEAGIRWLLRAKVVLFPEHVFAGPSGLCFNQLFEVLSLLRYGISTCNNLSPKGMNRRIETPDL